MNSGISILSEAPEIRIRYQGNDYIYEELSVRPASAQRVFGTVEAFNLIARAERDNANLEASSSTAPSNLTASQRKYLSLTPEERAKVDAIRAAVNSHRNTPRPPPRQFIIGNSSSSSGIFHPYYSNSGVASSSRSGPNNANQLNMVRVAIEALKRKRNIVESITGLIRDLRQKLHTVPRDRQLSLIERTISMINGFGSSELATFVSQRVASLRQLREIIASSSGHQSYTTEDMRAISDTIFTDIQEEISALDSQVASEISARQRAETELIRNARSTPSLGAIADFCEIGDYKSALQNVSREWKKVANLSVEHITEIFRPYITIAGPEYATVDENDRIDSLVLETINPGDKLFVYPCTHGRQVDFAPTRGHTFLLEGFIAFVKSGTGTWNICPLCRGAFTIDSDDMLKFDK